MVFKSKPEIALDQIKAALAGGFASRVALADAGYGVDGAFGSGVTGMGLADAMGVQSTLSVWPRQRAAAPPKPWSGRGRKPSHVRRAADYRPVSAKQSATALLQDAWPTVSWCGGSNETLSSRFAAARIRPPSRHWKR